MNSRKIGNIITLIMLIYTVVDVTVHIIFFSIREDVLATFPMVGEVVSEGFNVVFAIVIIMIVSYGYGKNKHSLYLIIGAIFFYISQLHDFFDEFFVLSIPSIAFEVFAFPLALVFTSIGIYKAQQYQKSLNDDNERLKITYKEMSNMDSLTGLYNTRHFYVTVPKDIEKIQMEKRQLTLMIFDIDDFKLVNDTYGHLEGDRLISYMGVLIKEKFSQKYRCYRYGGEEFVVVLLDVDIKTGLEMAEAFRVAFSQKVFYVDNQSYQKTISIGIAALEAEDDVKMLLSKADKRLYDAKSSGKNKVCYR